jgi:hypothetical protein
MHGAVYAAARIEGVCEPVVSVFRRVYVTWKWSLDSEPTDFNAKLAMLGYSHGALGCQWAFTLSCLVEFKQSS